MKKNILFLCRIILVINSIYLLCIGDLTNTFVVVSALAFTFIPWGCEKLLGIYLTDAMIIGVVLFIMLSQWLGTYLRAYDVISWWDVMLHGVSGIFTSLVGLILIFLGDKDHVILKNKYYGVVCTMMFLMGSASAVFWEICEWFGDTFLGTFSQLGSLSDTMEDMIICVIVSGVFSLIVYIGLKQSKKNWFIQQIDEFVKINKSTKPS